MTAQQMKAYVAVVSEVERYRELTNEEKEDIVRMILDRPYMDLRCDWAFKHVLQNKEILKMLLNDFLPEQIESVSFLPNEIDKARVDDKNIIMDVLCESADGRKFIVEMQRKKKNSFKNRMMYYGASMLHRQLKPNQSYSELTPVYVICFMDFKLTHDTDQLVYRYSMRENETGEFYGNLLSIYLCELPRLKEKSFKGLDPVQSWFFILKNMRTFAGKPKDMGTRYAAVAEASRMHNLPDNEKIQYLRNMITEEERLDMGQAYYEDGLEEGKKKTQEDVIIRLLRFGMSPKDIATALDIPEETVKSI